jgi:hypothetical protein
MDIERVFEIAWSFVALYIGIFATFYTGTFIEKNASVFEKIHAKTGIRIFKRQAESTRAPFNYWFTKLIGTFFLIMGVLIFLGFISFGKQ